MSLEQLKEIRTRRMEKHTLEVSRARELLRQGEQAIEDKKTALETFVQWRLNQQDVLFNTLQGAAFSPQDLSNYMERLESLKKQEEDKNDEIKSAKEQLEVTRGKFREAQIALEEITKKVEKIKEIIAEEKRVSDIAKDRAEESQNEEIATMMSQK